MKTSFILTVDVEEEWNWDEGFPASNYSVCNTKEIVRFQNFCKRVRIRPTYFVNWAVVTDDLSVDFFRRLSKNHAFEVGAHIHPWNTPPFEEVINERNSHIINLPESLVKKKLAILTEKIENTFQLKPVSFRAGRWGINGKILKLIAEMGYKIDSSLIPFYDDLGFSYHKVPLTPYWPDFRNFKRNGKQGRILEIPASAGFNLRKFYLCDAIYEIFASKVFRNFHLLGMLDKLKILRKILLSPELSNSNDMISLINASLKNNHNVFNMFLHSSSLLPGGTQYTPNNHSVEVLYNRIEKVVGYLKMKKEVDFCTMSEFRTKYVEGAEV